MVPTRNVQHPSIGIQRASFIAVMGMIVPFTLTAASAEQEHRTKPGEAAQLRENADTLLKANRSVFGTVRALTSDQIKVDIGEVQPRFLPLNQAEQKGFPSIAEGDQVIVVLNAQNLLVDYHPLDGEASAHSIIRGSITQTLPVGQETVVIKSGGKEQSFPIRSQARSKVAAIPVGAAAVFLIDETDQIADVGLASHRAGTERAKPMTPIKGAHRKVDGTVTSPLKKNTIIVRTADGAEKPFEVRETLHEQIASLRKGDAVILLVGTDDKVIDVAVPPETR